MPIPSLFRAGDTVRWKDPSGVNWLNESVTSTDYTLKYYLRCNSSVASETITGTTDGTGWEFVIPASTTGGMNSGLWFFQALATKSGDEVTLYEGQFEVKKKISYTGTPSSDFEGRTQAEIDLESVTSAIRGIVANRAAEYTIADRTFKYADLGELRRRESQLKAEVVRERKANMIANGLGDPHQWRVRF